MLSNLSLYFWHLVAGGCSADPPTAGAESAAGRRGSKEALPHGHPEADQQTTHAAAFPFVHTNAPYDKLEPNLRLQVCSFCSQRALTIASCCQPTHLEGQAEEGQEQSTGDSGCRVGQDGQRLPGHITRLKQMTLHFTYIHSDANNPPPLHAKMNSSDQFFHIFLNSLIFSNKEDIIKLLTVQLTFVKTISDL